MSSSKKQKLLTDVLEDANYAAFKAETEALAKAELARARRKVVPMWLPLAASVLLGAGLLYRVTGERPGASPLVAGSDPMTFTSIPLGLNETVQSTAELKDLVLTSSDRTVELVVTESSQSVSELSDTELLGLISKQPGGGGFVQLGKQRKLVVFF